MKRLSLKMVTMLVLCLTPMVASAALVWLNFSGNFDESLGLSPGVSGSVSGTVTYDTNAAPGALHDFAAATSTPGLFYDPVKLANPPGLGKVYDTGFQL